MLRVTAVCAVVYTVFCLRDLMANRNALIAIDCLGIATLVGSLVASQRALRLLWVGLPFLGMGFFYALFVPFDKALRHPNPEFVILFGGQHYSFYGRHAVGVAQWWLHGMVMGIAVCIFVVLDFSQHRLFLGTQLQ